MKTAITTKQNITKRFMLIFAIITLVIFIVSIGFAYNFQAKNFHESVVANMRYICVQLRDEIKADESNFYAFEKYMMSIDRNEIYIDPDFESYKNEKLIFDKAFAKAYPGLVYGEDVKFNDMDDELKKMYCIWYQEYWIERFEYYREVYNSPYTYYVYPTGVDNYIMYIVDIIRETDEEAGDNRMLLWDNYPEDLSEMPILIKTWETEQNTDEIDVFHNEWGNTYSYYMLVYLNGEKMGVVCADMDIDAVNKEIFTNTVNLMFAIGLIIFISLAFLAFYINKKYIKRLSLLNENIEEYARERDYKIVERIKDGIKYNDEIDALAWRIISLINQIHCHITDMMMVTESLNNSNEKIQKLTELSETDGLTKLYNKLAFTKHEKILNELILQKKAHFAVIMFDLNFLKKINDTCGHDKGDEVLMRLARYLKTSFRNEKIYRIGGDEFVVIVEDYEKSSDITAAIDKFNQTIKRDNINSKQLGNPLLWEQTSVAVGYSEVLSGDIAFSEVFKRADELMYANKRALKAERTD